MNRLIPIDVMIEVAQSRDVTTLDLESYGESLDAFPEQLWELQQLRVLKLSAGTIHTLPPQIANLQQLEELHFIDTNITELPEQLTRLPNLRMLNLSGMDLTDLPPCLDAFLNLRSWIFLGYREKFYHQCFATLMICVYFICHHPQ